MDQKAVLSSVPAPPLQPMKVPEPQIVLPMALEDEKLSHANSESTVAGLSDASLSKKLVNASPVNSTNLKEIDNELALPDDVSYENVRDSFDLSYDPVRDSGISSSTVVTRTTSMGTTISYGVAVPMHMNRKIASMC